MLKAALFDLDETLIDRSAMVLKYLEGSYQRFQPGLSHVPYELYLERFICLDAFGYNPKEQVFQNLIDEFKLNFEMPGMNLDFHTYYPPCAVLYEEAELVLRTLREKGFKLGIITNGASNSQRSKLERTGLNNLVDSIVISEEVGFQKPDPAIFEIALKQLQISSSEAIFIGDNPVSDIVGGAAAKMMTVWYENHIPCPPGLTINPDYVIHSIGETLSLSLFTMGADEKVR